MHLHLLPSHSSRIDLANTVANAAGVPLGNVLVYDVVQFNYSQEACLSAILRFTGASGEYQVEQWVGLLPQVVDGAVTSSGGRGCHLKWWTGLSLQVVGGAVTSSGGQGCHLKWWAGLSFQKVGGALDLTERTGLSPQVIGVAPSQGVGILSS